MSKTTTTTHIPQLRFPGFFDDWEEKRLGGIAKFSKWKGISKDDIVGDWELECVRYWELYTIYSEVINIVQSKTDLDPKKLVLSKKNDVIIPSSGETHIDIATASCVLRDGIALWGDLNIIKTKNNGIFLSYYLNNARKIDIARLAQWSSVIHLYQDWLKILKLSLPSLPEQEKIANFLTTVDKKIEQLQSLHQNRINYKQGVMQQIFSQSIRFQDEEGNDFPEWEEKKLGEIAKFSKWRGLPKIEIVEGWIYKCIHYGELFTVYPELIKKIYSSTNIDNGYIRSFWDEILMPTSDVTPNWLATASALMKSWVILWWDILIIRSEKLYNLFFSYYIKSHKKDIMRLVSWTTVVHIYASDLRKLKIQIPSLPEQEKIANFLSSLDEKIEQIDQQIEQLQVWKKGLLQKIFI